MFMITDEKTLNSVGGGLIMDGSGGEETSLGWGLGGDRGWGGVSYAATPGSIPHDNYSYAGSGYASLLDAAGVNSSGAFSAIDAGIYVKSIPAVSAPQNDRIIPFTFVTPAGFVSAFIKYEADYFYEKYFKNKK